MNRAEAVNLLKEISDKCDSLSMFGVALMPPDADNVLSTGFQIHILGNVGEECFSSLKPIIEKSNLHLKMIQEKNVLIIYRPIKP